MLIDPMFNPKSGKGGSTFTIDLCGSACEVLYVENCSITASSISWDPGKAVLRVSLLKNEYHRVTLATISGPKENLILKADMVDAIKPMLLAALYDKPFEPLVVVR
jgi:hypothetical protein